MENMKNLLDSKLVKYNDSVMLKIPVFEGQDMYFRGLLF